MAFMVGNRDLMNKGLRLTLVSWLMCREVFVGNRDLMNKGLRLKWRLRYLALDNFVGNRDLMNKGLGSSDCVPDRPSFGIGNRGSVKKGS